MLFSLTETFCGGTNTGNKANQDHLRRPVDRTQKSFRTVGIHSGIAQLSLLEHSLCPLDIRTSLTPGLSHQACYRYNDAIGQRRTATAKLHLPLGLSSADEFTLWGLLALTLREPEAESHFAATPHYCLKQLGVIDAKSRRGGKNYELFRQTLRRLAAVSYENDAFFDPVRGEHAEVAFGFLSYRLPRTATSDRLWHFYWDPVFFEFCSAVRGSLMFDLRTYRSLSPAARRLFLLLHKVFFRRTTSPDFDIRQLTVQALGFASHLTAGILKRKISHVTDQLLKAAVVCDVEWFDRRGVSMIRFHRGAYFQNRRRGRQQLSAATSSLTDALLSLGFENSDAERVTRRYSTALLREWIDITIAARERFGSTHFKRSPQAFLMHHLSKAASGEYAPPDWWRELQKQEHRHDDSAAPELRKILRLNVKESSDDRTQAPVHIRDLLKTIS